MEHDILELPDARRIAYRRVAGEPPGIVFLGGFRSDMTGTKAEWLEARARGSGRGFLRFDYAGHGASAGDFATLGIGDWLRDARDAVTRLTEGPQVLVGSSMGGWIALLLAKPIAERVQGLVGVAAAPDFTEDAMWAGFGARERRALVEVGRVEMASAYSEEPYVISRKLIEDGRRWLVLRERLELPFSVRLLHGTADADVAMTVPLRLLEHAQAADMRLTVVKGADHRFSTPACLEMIWQAVQEVSAR